MSTDIYLSIVIPAYNEEKRIGKTLKSLETYIAKQSFAVEVIVVVNNTTDRTREVVEATAETMPYLKVIDIGMVSGGGKGLAVQQGMLVAKGNYRLFMDADGAVAISEIEKFWPYLSGGFDVVFGSRYISGADADRVWYRDLLGRLANIVVQALLLRGVKDTQCGFKMFTAKAAQNIFSSLTVRGWGFDLELLTIAKRRGYKIKEVPVVWREIGSSNLKSHAFLSSFKDLLSIKRNLRKRIYD